MERQQFCREKYSGLIASANSKPKYTKKSLLSNSVPKIHSKKITAAVHCQFLSKAALMPIVSRCNGSEREKKNRLFYDMQHVQRVNPTRCASAGIVRKIQILFPLHAQTTRWFIWQAPKWEMQIAEEWAWCRADRISRKTAFCNGKYKIQTGSIFGTEREKALIATLWHFIVLLFKLRHHWFIYATTCVFVQEWMPLFFTCVHG